MEKIIFMPLDKTLLPIKGRARHWYQERIGPISWQDCSRLCHKTSDLQLREKDSSEILVATAAQLGCCIAAEIYTIILKVIGGQNIVTTREGWDTYEQLEVGLKYADNQKSKLVLVCTFLHWPRVWWACQILRWHLKLKVKVCYKIAFGIPRPIEVISDLVQLLYYPFIDIFCLRTWYQTKNIVQKFYSKNYI